MFFVCVLLCFLFGFFLQLFGFVLFLFVCLLFVYSFICLFVLTEESFRRNVNSVFCFDVFQNFHLSFLFTHPTPVLSYCLVQQTYLPFIFHSIVFKCLFLFHYGELLKCSFPLYNTDSFFQAGMEKFLLNSKHHIELNTGPWMAYVR